MTDFLHRLALRTLAPDRLVRPRLLSLFERVEGTAPGAIVEDDAFEDGPKVDSPSSRPRSPDPAPAPPLAAEIEIDPLHAAAGLPAQPVTVPPKPPTPTEGDELRVESLTVARRPRREQPSRQESAPEGVPPSPGKASAAPQPALAEAPAASPPEPPIAPPSRVDAGQERRSLPAKPILEWTRKIGWSGSARVSVEASARPEGLRRRERRDAQRGQEPEPTVHVSIGRVEVRAVAAPAAPRKRAPDSPPGKRLDEYLRERDGAR
jgi:hypothetical protein